MVFESGHNTSLCALVVLVTYHHCMLIKILKALCIPLSEYTNRDLGCHILLNHDFLNICDVFMNITLYYSVCPSEGEKEEVSELMMIVIQDKLRQRRKHLGRLQRHLGPPELHLWEKEEEEEDRGSKHGMAMLRQLSLGTTLSTSTLTDCGYPPVCSDGDTADNTSEAISREMHSRTMTR